MRTISIVVSALIMGHSLMAQSVVVTNTKINVLYMGVDNPVDVAIENCDCSKIFIELSSGNLEGFGCNYHVKPTSTNPIDLKVYKMKGNHKKLVTTKSFKVKRVPVPIVQLGGFTDGAKIPRSILYTASPVAYIESFDFDVEMEIRSFEVFWSIDGISYSFYIYRDKQSNQFVYPENYADKVNQVRPDTKVYFDNIKVKLASETRIVAPLTFNIM